MIDLLCGAKVASKEPLKKVSIDRIYKAIAGESESLSKSIQQLRFIKTLNEKQYTVMKRELPFITASWFNPKIRNKEHFAYSECLILDIDHIAEKELSITTLRNQLEQDSRIMLMFVSPSNNGLKLLFKLDEKIYDPMKYSILYRQFGSDFSKQYGLEQIIDLSTSDVSRACFMSYDTEAYFNIEAEPIKVYSWLPKTDFELMELYDSKPTLKQRPTKQKDDCNVATPIDPDEDVLNQIKEWVGLRKSKNKKEVEENILVSEKLTHLKPAIIEFLATKKLEVYEARNINYGIKIKAKLGSKEAEVNLFFGKKGFSVVESPKQGTNAELNGVMKELLELFFNDIDK